MSCLLNVWVSKCLDLYAVAQCLGGTMSGWLNVLGSKMSFFSKVSKCLGDTMSGWQNVSATQCLGVKMSVRQNVKVSKCWGVKMSRLQNVGCRDVGEPRARLQVNRISTFLHWSLQVDLAQLVASCPRLLLL